MMPEWNSNPETLEPLKDFQAWEENQDRDFECNRCGKAYMSLKSLRRHRFHCGRTFNPMIGGFVQTYEESEDQAQFKCTYCNRAYRWKKGLTRHQQRCEAKMALENSEQVGEIEIDILEDSPGKLSDGPRDATLEENKDTREETDQASQNLLELEDDKSEDERPSLVRGSKSMGSRNRDASCGRFQCILCGKRYGWLKNLRRHQRICRKIASKHRWKECKVMIEPLKLRTSKRLSEQNFKCQTCDKEFRWLRDLRQHQANCSSGSQNLWNVSEASSKLGRNSSMQKNQRRSEENSNLDGSNVDGVDACHKCVFCGNKYTWRRSLRRHYLKCGQKGELSLNVVE